MQGILQHAAFDPHVRVDGVPYLDGGLADSVPIQRALTYGNRKIVVILTRNPGYRKRGCLRGWQGSTGRRTGLILLC